MKDCLKVYDNAFTSDECERYMDYMDKLEDRSLIQETKFRHKVDHKSINLAHEYDLQAWSWVGESFFPTLHKCVEDYFDEYSILQNQRYLFHDIKLKKIPEGGGFHDWHFETGSPIACTRIIVVQLYLNTVHNAGETEFLYLNKRIDAVQGRVIIFPAAFTHTHRGNPPIGQTKYIATSWGSMQSND
tara:strand:+ start:2505 stop:3065 length:561 start_codon:yes stop_codon:yes gene_type:complete